MSFLTTGNIKEPKALVVKANASLRPYYTRLAHLAASGRAKLGFAYKICASHCTCYYLTAV
ncbi:hypothetical protein AGMMS50233_00730 [Endomicrobiia bacterium]|nr:hypothetical protein AGMMS50233_00730 [Endomicrobiia bacterium]